MTTLDESELKANPLFRALVRQLSALVGAVTGPGDEFKTFEAMVLRVGNLANRAVLEERLRKLAKTIEADEELLVDGKPYHRHEEGTVTYHSLSGPLDVRRSTYRRSDERNGSTVVPLELAAGLVEGATPALGYSVTLGYAQGELRGYAESMEAAHRQLPSRSTLERMAKAIGSEARKEAVTIEARLRKQERLPEGAHGLSTGLDRVAIPMEEDRAPEAPPKTRRKERTKPYERAKPKPIDVNYRMAYVGTVSVVDENGEELVTRRYTALPDAEPDEVVDKLLADVRRGLQQDAELVVGVVQDGAPELWQAMERGFKKTDIQNRVEAIDRYHLNERLGAALQLVEPEAGKRTALLSAWNDDLDRSDGAIDKIQDWLGDRIGQFERTNDEAVDGYLDHLKYIENNQHRMRYTTVKAKGLPVGSGLTEGACKSVVGQRACGSGQRWRPEGISAALTLRAIHRSDRLPTFWNELSKGYTAEIRSAA